MSAPTLEGLTYRFLLEEASGRSLGFHEFCLRNKIIAEKHREVLWEMIEKNRGSVEFLKLQKTTQNSRGRPQVSANCANCAKVSAVSAISAKTTKRPIFIDGEEKLAQLAQLEQKQDAINKSNTLKGIALMTLREFSNKNQNITTKWLIPGFVPEKSICMLAAKRASMKTFVALYFALSAAAGTQNVLGKPDACRVVYLDYENGEFEMNRRISGLCGSFDQGAAAHNLHIATYPPIRLDKDGGVDALIDTINATGAKLVVVDTQRRLTSSDENASETSNSILEGLQSAIIDTGCSFILLHHMRKGSTQKGQQIEDEMDEIRGSSDIPASCAVIFYIKRQGTTDKFLLKQLKNRFAPERKPIQMHIEGQAPELVKVVSDGEIEDAVATENALVNEIWDWLVQERRFEVKTSEINARFIGSPPFKYSRRSVTDAIAVLRANNKLEMEGKRGQYRMILPKKQEKLLKEHGSLAPEK